MSNNFKRRDTSWHKVGKWYGGIVGESGHFFHKTVVLPNTLKLLKLKRDERLVDIACGQGFLAENIPDEMEYLGIDLAKSLIDQARRRDRNPKHKYIVADASTPLERLGEFDKATIILALQNIKDGWEVIKNCSKLLKSGGKLLIVLNHPCFRIPRQSSWEEDKQNKMQYRRINRYMTELEVPINMHPGRNDGPVTWSFHHPISDYSAYLYDNGFLIEKIEEWTSNKQSEGKHAKSENMARSEFPMFLAMLAIKK